MRLLNILVIGALILAASFVYKIKFDSTLQAERVAKLRGSSSLSGRHRFVIGDQGVVVYPRLEAALSDVQPLPLNPTERVPFGAPRAAARHRARRGNDGRCAALVRIRA